MSGIAGLFNQNNAPVTAAELNQMVFLLERRGPERTAVWHNGPVGLGHTLLTTTPEAAFEHLPLLHDASGCSITADVRLDNREELLTLLGLADRSRDIGDAEIILFAYLTWGESCVERFLGDFAFAIWDPRHHKLFVARDHFGMRPLYYHHAPDRFVAIASEPRAILVLPQTPYRINEGRIADFLVSYFEGIDKTSTFFEEVYRLPPAHRLIATPQGLRIECYWTLEPGPELRLSSNEAYAEAFLDVFTEAVRCRLRAVPGTVGSMLSGGMDSGSIVAVARGLLAEAGQGPLPTFSAVGPDPENCVETRTIHVSLTMDGLDSHCINYDRIEELEPELSNLTWSLDEPFDCNMTLVRGIYLNAWRLGIKVLMDGACGDVVLSEGSYLARLLRRGHWLTAYREAVAQNHFWGGGYPARQELYRAARAAFIPDVLRSVRRRLRSPNLERRLEIDLRDSFINPDFARRIDLLGRLRTMDSYRYIGLLPDYGRERALVIDQPFVTTARERYSRTASATAVEPRDPFLDRRVVAFCLTLPGEQKLADGWPKAILRRSMAGRLPDAVRWCRNKEHLGWDFTKAFFQEFPPLNIMKVNDVISPYIDVLSLRRSGGCFTLSECAPDISERVYWFIHLAAWLDRHSHRPQSVQRDYPLKAELVLTDDDV